MATDEKVTEDLKKLAETFGPFITSIRNRRAGTVEEAWLLNHAAWRAKHQRRQFISDTFSHYVPAARRAVERFVKRLSQMVVPSLDFFEVYPGDEGSDVRGDQAESVQSYLQFLLTRRLRVRSLVKQWARTYLLYGRAVSKTTIIVETARVPVPDRAAGTLKFAEVPQVWPTTRVVDPFMFYYWPETESDLERAQVLIEDNLMPLEVFQAHVTAKVADRGIPPKDLTKPEWPRHWTRRLEHSGLQAPSDSAAHGASPSDLPQQEFVALSEVHFKRQGAWHSMWLVWNVPEGPVVVRLRKTRRHPYRLVLAREVPGEHYTSSMMDDLEPLQVFLNDEVNLTMEGQAMVVGPPVAINPDLLPRAQVLTFKPRAKWYIDPAAIKWMEVPDTTRSGVLGINMASGFIDTYAGSSPLAEGSPTRNLPRAGFAVSSLMNLALGDIRDAAEDIEDGLLTPLLADLFRLAMEFVPSEQIIHIPGTQNFPARSLHRGDLVGDWDFKWVGSLQFQDSQVKAQKMMTFVAGLGKFLPTLEAELRSKGKRLNLELLFKRIWRDGLGERGADSLIIDMTEEEKGMSAISGLQAIMQQMGQRTGGAGGAQPV